MRTQYIIECLLPMAESRIMAASNDNLAQYNERGVAKSSFAYLDSLKAGVEVMNKEVTEILNKLEALSPSKRELNDIGSLLVQFISKQFDALTENSSAVTGMQLPSSGPFIERRKKETEAILEIRMIMMRKKSADKRKQSRWEIFKLVFSSAFGAAVTWVVKSYLGG